MSIADTQYTNTLPSLSSRNKWRTVHIVLLVIVHSIQRIMFVLQANERIWIDFPGTWIECSCFSPIK